MGIILCGCFSRESHRLFLPIVCHLLSVLLITPVVYGHEVSNSIVWEATSINLGTTAPSEIYNASFVFRNCHSFAVSIRKETPCCGSVSAQTANPPVLPNATAVLSFKIRASGADGPFSRIIHVAFDHGEVFDLAVEGNTHNLFVLSPPWIRIAGAVLNGRYPVSFDISIEEGCDAEIYGGSLDTGELDLSDFMTTPIPGGVRCSCTIVCRAAKNRTTALLIIRTSDKHQPTITLPVIVHNDSPVDIIPPVAFCGIVKPRATMEKTLQVRSRDQWPVKIKSVKACDLLGYTTQDVYGYVNLNIRLISAGSPGFATGELVLELDDSTAPQVTIPYSYMVRK